MKAPESSQRPAPLIHAAAYVRMSTEHQKYSTSNQMDVIREYAKAHGMEIGKVYSDDGKSGLSIKGRYSFSQMITDVENGKTGYSHILAYDVSRWSRFQNVDESGYYEYICKRAGISVHYCAEQFENDGSPGSSLLKTMKRTMAGEYSRGVKLSIKRKPVCLREQLTSRLTIRSSRLIEFYQGHFASSVRDV